MKKTYIIPSVEIELLTEEEAVLAGSFSSELNDTNPVDGSDALSGDYADFWN